MKLGYYKLLILLVILAGCEIEEQVNPNNPALNTILSGATKTDLNNLVTGSLAEMRESYSTYVTALGTVSRELYLFDADPRNRTDLLGVGLDELDNNSFYTTASWNRRYRTIKNLNILLEATDNADAGVSEAERNGYRGFANTLLAHQLLLLINAQNDNGIRLDVADPDNFGPIVSKDEAFAKIAEILSNGATQLGGAEFSMSLSSGFGGFDTPSSFLTFNRALAARVALYRGNYSEALTTLPSSFFDLNGDLTIGPKMSFSTSGGDLLNGLFKSPQQSGDQIVVNNSFISDAEPGDLRVANKTAPRDNPTSSSGVNGTHETRLYGSVTSPVDIIRNEELILIYAEASVQEGAFADALTGINVIRNSADLPAYVGPNTTEALIDEILHQRRYSLWAEGHRMIDLRRYNRLNTDYVTLDVITDPDDNADQQIFLEFPIPLTEN